MTVVGVRVVRVDDTYIHGEGMGFMRNRSGWLRWQNAEELRSEFDCVTWVNVDAQTRFQKLTTMADKKSLCTRVVG